MNEFLSTLLQAVLIAAVPVFAGAITKGVQAGARYLASRMESETAKKYLAAAKEAAKRAVTYTSQTYVDALKNSGTFTKENQEEALAKAVDTAKGLLTAEAKTFLAEAYGDLNEYLKTNIEAEVRMQKKADTDIAIGPITAVAPGEPSDVTAVAAATAAATAATVAQTAIAQATSPEEQGEGEDMTADSSGEK